MSDMESAISILRSDQLEKQKSYTAKVMGEKKKKKKSLRNKISEAGCVFICSEIYDTHAVFLNVLHMLCKTKERL